MQPASSLIIIWWLLGLATVGGRVLGYLIAPMEDPLRLNMMYEALVRRGLLIDIMTTATDLIGAAAALMLIASITRMQMSHPS